MLAKHEMGNINERGMHRSEKFQCGGNTESVAWDKEFNGLILESNKKMRLK